MFDIALRRLVDPALNRIGGALAQAGLGANAITLAGVPVALGAACAIADGLYGIALVLILFNRLLDGLDGAVARISGPSEFGGYLDSLADFLFYVAIPVGFGIADPANLLPALLLVASFTLTGTSFLALAAIMAGRDLGHGEKALTYSTGLMEGGETIAFFVVMCWFPAVFPQLAIIFAGLCLLTVGQRLWLARGLLRQAPLPKGEDTKPWPKA